MKNLKWASFAWASCAYQRKSCAQDNGRRAPCDRPQPGSSSAFRGEEARKYRAQARPRWNLARVVPVAVPRPGTLAWREPVSATCLELRNAPHQNGARHFTRRAGPHPRPLSDICFRVHRYEACTENFDPAFVCTASMLWRGSWVQR